MDYKFVINDFEGPLDLLLHLVKTSEMDIYDISVEKITEQYLEFIRRMEEMNLTVASEYLVMAAELIELKSRLLLPNSKNDEDDEYDEEYINSKYEYPEEENNILEDLYKIKNNDTETHNTPFLREEQNNIENNNNEKIENTETKMDEFFSKNTRIEFSEGRIRRKHGKGKHS